MTRDKRVRPALVADADDIAAVHVQAWREAYAQLIPEESLAALDVDVFAARWRRTIEAGVMGVWVALDGARVIGWASASAGRDAEPPYPLEVEGIYVLASHYGTGAGQSLLDAAIGQQGAYLWMANGNARALSFYERNGFTPDGETDSKTLAGTPIDIIRLTRSAVFTGS